MACKSADVSQRCMVELTAKFSELNQVYNPRGLNFSLNSGMLLKNNVYLTFDQDLLTVLKLKYHL